MGRNVPLEASPLGNLVVQRNKKTGKYKGVIVSGKRRQARAWCTRRRRFIPLGTFDTSPQAAVAVAAAEATGVESMPTPRARKARTSSRAGTHDIFSNQLAFLSRLACHILLLLLCAYGLRVHAVDSAPAARVPFALEPIMHEVANEIGELLLPSPPSTSGACAGATIRAVAIGRMDAPAARPASCGGLPTLPTVAAGARGPRTWRARPMPASLRAARAARGLVAGVQIDARVSSREAGGATI